MSKASDEETTKPSDPETETGKDTAKDSGKDIAKDTGKGAKASQGQRLRLGDAGPRTPSPARCRPCSDPSPRRRSARCRSGPGPRAPGRRAASRGACSSRCWIKTIWEIEQLDPPKTKFDLALAPAPPPPPPPPHRAEAEAAGDPQEEDQGQGHRPADEDREDVQPVEVVNTNGVEGEGEAAEGDTNGVPEGVVNAAAAAAAATRRRPAAAAADRRAHPARGLAHLRRQEHRPGRRDQGPRSALRQGEARRRSENRPGAHLSLGDKAAALNEAAQHRDVAIGRCSWLTKKRRSGRPICAPRLLDIQADDAAGEAVIERGSRLRPRLRISSRKSCGRLRARVRPR